jgi:hypothetical protein
MARNLQQLSDSSEQDFRPSLRDQDINSEEDDNLMAFTLGCIKVVDTATVSLSGVLRPNHGIHSSQSQVKPVSKPVISVIYLIHQQFFILRWFQVISKAPCMCGFAQLLNVARLVQ